MMLSAGKFNKRIQLQAMGEEGFDENGYPIEAKPVYRVLWAMVKPVSATEYTKERANQTENITRFVIRYRKNLLVNDDMTIVYGGRNYAIESVINDDERDITLTIIGREVS